MNAPTADWLNAQRWFASKGSASDVGEAVSTPIDDRVTVTLVEVGGDQYQLVSEGDAPDSLDRPETGAALVAALRSGQSAAGPAGEVVFSSVPGAEVTGDAIRPVGVEQSNSSLIVDDEWILKVFRRIRPGTNPELEVLRFLTERGAAHVPEVGGWYEVRGGPVDGTLGMLQRLVPGATDGWTWMLQRLPWQPQETIEPLHQLGSVLASLHAQLAAPHGEAFGTTEGGPKLAQTIVAGIQDDAERVSRSLPTGDHELRSLLEQAGRTASDLADGLDAGPAQRVHGDLHLGQTLLGPEGWTVIDWEGEPSRPIEARRARQPALRDVAGMLRSLSYVAAAAERSAAAAPLRGWHAAARAALLDGYLATADPDLLPTQTGAIRRLLSLLELEKVVYEVGYEAENRPNWLAIPASALEQATRSRAA